MKESLESLTPTGVEPQVHPKVSKIMGHKLEEKHEMWEMWYLSSKARWTNPAVWIETLSVRNHSALIDSCFLDLAMVRSIQPQ